jgi:threonine synthase
LRNSPEKKTVRHICVKCRKEFPHTFLTFCDCGGMIEVEYDLKTARLYDSQNPYVRYFDLLPVEHLESLLEVKQAPTPTIHARRLGNFLGLRRLYLKDESVLPTRTTKDRMAVVVLSFLRELGIRQYAASSTGNTTTALAHYIHRAPGLRLFLFAAEDFVPRLNYEETDQVVAFGLRGATVVEAQAAGRELGKRGSDIISERGFFEPARRAGLKTAFFEAVEAIPQPVDWYVQAVSSAMGVYGIYQGARELQGMGRLSRLPHLLCVQEESCKPMVSAFEAASEVIRPQDIVKRPSGIAQAILGIDPSLAYPHVRRIVIESGGTMLAVSEQEIRDARRMVKEHEGINPCFTAAAAVAGLVRLARKGAIPVEQTVLVNLTGGDREQAAAPRSVHWLERTASGWRAEDRNDSIAREYWG